MYKEKFIKTLSIDDALKLLKKMLEEDDQTEERSGRTRLVTLAEEIDRSNPEDKYRRVFGWTIHQSAKLLPELSVEGIVNLHFLLKSSNIGPLSYADTYRRAFLSNKEWRMDSNKVRQRAEVFRLLSESGEKFTGGDLSREKEIKEKFPWLWIDVAVRFYLQGYLDEVKCRLENDGEVAVQQLLMRLPLWCRLRGKALIKDISDNWQRSLNKLGASAKTKIEESLRVRGYDSSDINKALYMASPSEGELGNLTYTMKTVCGSMCATG